MRSLEEIKEIKKECEKEWFKKYKEHDNVVGVDIGNKFVKKHRTPDVSIRLLVKVDTKGIELDPIEPEVDGVKTDVIEREFCIPEKSKEMTDGDDISAGDGNQRLKGGIGIGSGTLGAIVKKRGTAKDEGLMLLTCEHVLGNLGKESKSLLLSGSNYSIEGGRENFEVAVKRFDAKKLSDPGVEFETGIDSAVVPIDVPFKNHTSEIREVGRIRGTWEAERGMEVRKFGRTTGLTYGFVDSVSLTLRVGNDLYFNQIGIVSDLMRNWKFGYDGDSGSVIVNNSLEAVGLLIARDVSGIYCAATPIQEVLDALKVDMYEEQLFGLDRDIDESVRAIPMLPPPLTEDISRFLYGEYICCCHG